MTQQKLINLASRVIRSKTVQNGIRTITVRATTTDEDKGILANIWGGFKSVVGDLLKGLMSALSWTLTGLWTLITTSAMFLMNFNWNITEQEIQAEINNAITTAAGILGQETGRTLGFLVCGALPTASLFAINPVMARTVAAQVAPELLDELVDNYATAIQQIGAIALRAGGLWLYGAVRRMWRGSDAEFKERLKAKGFNEEQINKEIENRNKPFTFAQSIQEGIEAIPNEAFRNFVENAYDEFGSSCIEAGYVVAGAIDSYIYQRKTSESEADIEIEFNPDGTYDVKQWYLG
ncbi:MAG TPA: hypothetical protein IGS40_07795 [Trichormus sp. M33_DOE_039]|nr:hypothetical protein [Trichormus sp. M33_DOE_039]